MPNSVIKNATGHFLSGVPKKCFQAQDACGMADCGQARGDGDGAAGERAVPDQATVLVKDDPLALQRAIDECRLQPLTAEQRDANLAVVMAREDEGGGHLQDRRHLADMPDFRHRSAVRATHPADVDRQQQQQTVFARGQYVS
jgi:hypothetical protein